MGELDGRVCVITGAGGGLGRTYALAFAREGASVVVNDIGVSIGGGDPDGSAAQRVVDEIATAGGKAVANNDDITTWDGAQSLIKCALESFGTLHVLVNNAGILRDHALVNMSESDWDDVIKVHLKGHFLPTRFAGEYWRRLSKDGNEVGACVINTTSTSGLDGNYGQANYGAAKSGIAGFSHIVAMELGPYGVRVNCIAPAARTRLTASTPGLADLVAEPGNDEFDAWDPENIAPFVSYLATEDCPVTDKVFFVYGSQVQVYEPWHRGASVDTSGQWTIESLRSEVPKLLN